MGWSIGYDETHRRDIGYGVPAYCDHPGCREPIDRGMGYACGGGYGSDEGCGLFFCGQHLAGVGSVCERCLKDEPPFDPSPDHPDWMRWKLSDESWQQWREQNPAEVEKLEAALTTNSTAAQAATDKSEG